MNDEFKNDQNENQDEIDNTDAQNNDEEEQIVQEDEQKSSAIYVILAAIIAIGLVFLVYVTLSPQEYQTEIITTLQRINPHWVSDTEITYFEVVQAKESLPPEAASSPDVVKAFGGSVTKVSEPIKVKKMKNITNIINAYENISKSKSNQKPVGIESAPNKNIILVYFKDKGNKQKLLAAAPIENSPRSYEVVKAIEGNFKADAGFELSPNGKMILVVSEIRNCIQVIDLDKGDGPAVIEYQSGKVSKGKFSM